MMVHLLAPSEMSSLTPKAVLMTAEAPPLIVSAPARFMVMVFTPDALPL